MPQGGGGGVGVNVGGNGTAQKCSSLLAAAKPERAVLWTDKNLENRKMKYGILILRCQKLNCSFDPVLPASVPPSIKQIQDCSDVTADLWKGICVCL